MVCGNRASMTSFHFKRSSASSSDAPNPSKAGSVAASKALTLKSRFWTHHPTSVAAAASPPLASKDVYTRDCRCLCASLRRPCAVSAMSRCPRPTHPESTSSTSSADVGVSPETTYLHSSSSHPFAPSTSSSPICFCARKTVAAKRSARTKWSFTKRALRAVSNAARRINTAMAFVQMPTCRELRPSFKRCGQWNASKDLLKRRV
mmetsp:Transcript_24954/g.83884  ORF Transcript_24954/g.83884 Transcript_24954/m.83884 type:complete len:205 (-) Transcript_24954:1088-1702(-)